MKDWRSKEQSFFASLDNLTTLYGLEKPDVCTKVYPDNIRSAYNHALWQMEKRESKTTLLIMQDDLRSACLVTAKTFDTNQSFYFIPLQPVWNLLQSKRYKKASQLLLSLLSYLYQIIRLPSFTTNDYLSYCHEILREWTENSADEYEPEELGRMLSVLHTASYFGKKLDKALRHPYHLQQWQQRMQNFTPQSITEGKILAVSKMAWKLFKDYPDTPFYQNMHGSLLYSDEDNIIQPDQYISFSWTNEGWLGNQLFEMLNNEFSECTSIIEPVVFQWFDQPQAKVLHDMDFETRLFHLLSETIDLLNELPHE